MPLNLKGALEWREEHKFVRGDKTGPKTIDYDYEDNERPRVPLWVRQERQEYLLAHKIKNRIGKIAGDDPELPVLREKYEQLADVVLQNYLELINAALWRRMLTCPGILPDEAFERYVEALSELVDKWQDVLKKSDDE